jgi:hypothetical protein
MGLPSKHAAGPAEFRRGTIPGRPLPAALTAAIAVALPPAGAPAGSIRGMAISGPDWRAS